MYIAIVNIHAYFLQSLISDFSNFHSAIMLLQALHTKQLKDRPEPQSSFWGLLDRVTYLDWVREHSIFFPYLPNHTDPELEIFPYADLFKDTKIKGNVQMLLKSPQRRVEERRLSSGEMGREPVGEGRLDARVIGAEKSALPSNLAKAIYSTSSPQKQSVTSSLRRDDQRKTTDQPVR
jgi:hypothetical protein